MKKLVKPIAIALIALFSTQLLTSCFGKFSLVRKLYDFNDKLMGNDLVGKLIKSAIFWAMMIVPIYELAGFVDFIILNLIEFWTGKNPIAMLPGETETQLVAYNGKVYKMTAECNKMTITDLELNKTTVLNFDNTTSSIKVNINGELKKIATYQPSASANAEGGFSIANN